MYIGKVKVSNEWESLEDLIQAQVDGQSSFEFASDTTYQLQGEGPIGVRMASVSAKPESDEDGERIFGTQVAIYEKDSGTLYVKAEQNAPDGQLLKISQLG